MPYIARMFPALVITSSGSTVTNAVSQCDDASNITIVVTTSVGGTTFQLQVSLFEPSQSYSVQQVVSSLFYTLQNVSSSVLYSVAPGQAITLSNVAFQQIRLLGTGGESSGTTVAWASKQITV